MSARRETPAPGGYVPKGVSATPPRRVPRVGVILDLDTDQWRYSNRPRSLRLLVTAVRPEVSLYYAGDWVWVRGVELAGERDGEVDGGGVVLDGQERGVLVLVDAIGEDDLDR